MVSAHILGAGALGSLWAAHWGRCTLLLRRRAGSSLPRHIRLRLSAPPTTASPLLNLSLPVESPCDDGPIDVLLVATKAFQVEDAISSVKHRLHPRSSLILLCNGALSLTAIAPSLCVPILAATTTHGCYLQATRLPLQPYSSRP